ncbi:fatty acyl-AMP ligase [Catellatospora sp. NPDC049609]|uniref:fatty acyl-AMP ligase n=1 Tax=Catellatospora sp. NPDC049609 TaxID=3155505 RepID=UPI00343B0809
MPSKPLLPDILATRAALTPDRRAYVFLNEDEAEEAVLTYAELHRRALAVAERLTALCAPGDRALLLFPPGLDFIVGYFGCLLAGVIAVPVNRPRKTRVQDATLSIIDDSRPAVVLTVSALAESARRNLATLAATASWLDVDRVDAAPGPGFAPQPCDADAVAFLQYTSGSTSAPKGVMVTHGNLIANQEMMTAAFSHDEHATVVGWAPLYHDQGLIGNVLNPLYVGSTSVLMSPLVFIRWPLRWLTAVSRYRAHTSGGPNFAYEACVARAAKQGVPEVDLGSWRIAFNGAEPIRHDTLQRFAETFAPVGFRAEAHFPCYGLAEATLMVSGAGLGRGARVREADVDALGRRRFVPGTAGRSQTLVGSGAVAPGQQVRIVDPETGRRCADDEIGEIWVSGGNVTKGYWRNAEATAATFQARLAGDERAYLRTGDLGFLRDGELYIVGRLKDMIIVRGRNLYPQDIEYTVQTAHAALQEGGCAAFSVPGPDGERLVVVQEIKREQLWEADRMDVASSIRAAVTREHEISLGDLVLTKPVQLQKTSSGKIMRAAARRRYLDADFELWTPRASSMV